MAARARKGQTRPSDSIPYQTASRLLVANQVFLGSWTVDICQEGHRLRSALQRRHMAHLRWCSHGAPGKLRSWDREVIKTQPTWDSEFAKHMVA